ncbi:hypothetical protein [Microcystis phage Mel-JY01]
MRDEINMPVLYLGYITHDFEYLNEVHVCNYKKKSNNGYSYTPLILKNLLYLYKLNCKHFDEFYTHITEKYNYEFKDDPESYLMIDFGLNFNCKIEEVEVYINFRCANKKNGYTENDLYAIEYQIRFYTPVSISFNQFKKCLDTGLLW